jgi:hypothetical protein
MLLLQAGSSTQNDSATAIMQDAGYVALPFQKADGMGLGLSRRGPTEGILTKDEAPPI